MRYRILIIAVLLATRLVGSAQGLVAVKPTVSCGITGYGIPVTATFELKSNGSKRIVIDSVKPACGCTSVSMPKNELGAGDRCEMKISYDARMLGHFEKSAAVYYHLKHGNNDSSPLYLKMEGVVLTQVKDYSAVYPYAIGDLLTDKEVLEFDDVNLGEQPQLVINILNNHEHPVQPNVQHLPSYLTAEVIPTELLPGKSGKVVFTLQSQQIRDFGLMQTAIYLASQLGEKVRPETEVPVSVVLLPDLKKFEGQNKQYATRLELSDSTVELGMIGGKVRKKAEIILKNSGRLQLDISSLQMFTKGVELTLSKRQLQPGEQTKLKIVGELEKLKKGRSKPRVLMITNDPDHSKVVIPIYIKK